MSLAEDRGLATARRWLGGRLAILVAAVVFAALAFAGMLPVPYAVAGFALVTAAIFAMRTGTDDDRRAQPVAIAAPGDGLLRALVAGLPDPVVALDRDGRVLALNDRARALAPALRQGEPVAFALRMPELIEAISRAAAEGEEKRVVYYERVPHERWFETIVMPVKREPLAAVPDLVLMTFHDLTPLRRVEEMRADFVANASHELRTPLAALLGFIETLQGSAREDAKARDRFLGIMQEQARRMARLIDDPIRRSIWFRSCARSSTGCRRWRATAG
jgi:two-component system, OmpR family, phosphate regulon sensor histidine kinase PhoR